MCGIIGYAGNKDAPEVVLKGLKKLEYRGYDSWGIITGNFDLVKNIGKIGHIQRHDLNLRVHTLAIGHTRWSTHWGVTLENAHPHLSQDKSIAVVHNGIIENYQQLKAMLQKEGFVFVSETDTEVIPHLLQKYYKETQDFKKAFTKMLNKIDGSYAILAIQKGNHEIHFAKNGSPLVLGVGKNEYFVASDVPAFLEYSNQVIFLEDNHYGTIGTEEIGKEIQIFDLKTHKKIISNIQTINWKLEEAEKGNEPHFMIKEIKEQQETIRKSVEQSSETFAKTVSMIKDARGVFLIGCGTSYHACLSASYQFAHLAKMHINVVLASEFRNYTSFLNSKSLIIAVSQSGETADVIDAIKIAKEKMVKVLSIVNVKGSTIERLSDHCINMQAGPEICVVSTKAYTAELAILSLLALTLTEKIEDARKKILENISCLPRLIEENTIKLKKLAEKIKNQKSIFIIGRDIAYPAALEGALKIKEVSYIHAEGFAGGELKHGTIALIEKGTPCIILATPETRNLIISNAMEIKARGGFIIGIDQEENNMYDETIIIPNSGCGNALILTIPLQILAYHLAVARGCDVDKPRNLAKSVTVK